MEGWNFLKVLSINKTADQSFLVDHGSGVNAFDVVIVATPQTDDKDPIQFFGFDNEFSFPGNFHRTVATMVRGDVDETFFGLSPKSTPALFIVDRESNVNSVTREVPVDYAEGEEGEK